MAAILRADRPLHDRHWAVVVSVAAHAALVGVLIARLGPTPPTASMPRIEIEFAAEPAPEPAPPIPAEASAPPPPAVEAMLPEPQEPPPELEAELPPEAEPPPEPELLTTTAPDASTEAPPVPHRKPPPPREKRQVAARPPEPPRSEPPRAEPVQQAAQPAAEASPQVARAPAAPAPVPAPVPSGPSPDYLALLQSKIQRSLEYPRSARQAGIQGAPVLWFALDGAGRLLEWRIVRSSGHEQLDREAEAALRRAAPFPPIPDSYGGRMEVQVPVAFRLR
jgi:protein TonB